MTYNQTTPMDQVKILSFRTTKSKINHANL